MPEQPFNFRWNLSTANGGLREIRILLTDPKETFDYPASSRSLAGRLADPNLDANKSHVPRLR